MKANKICKKILAYTLTTAMTLGFFAASGIKLNVAWASDVALSSASEGDITVETSGTDNYTVAASFETAHNICFTETSPLALSDKTITVGTNHKIEITNAKELSVKNSTAVQYKIKAGTSAEDTAKAKITAGGIIASNSIKNCTIENATITAIATGSNATDSQLTLENVTLTNVKLVGVTQGMITLKNCAINSKLPSLSAAFVKNTGEKFLVNKDFTEANASDYNPIVFTNSILNVGNTDVLNLIDISAASTNANTLTMPIVNRYKGSIIASVDLGDNRGNYVAIEEKWINENNTAGDSLNVDKILEEETNFPVVYGGTISENVRDNIKSGKVIPWFSYTSTSSEAKKLKSDDYSKLAKLVTLTEDTTIKCKPLKLDYVLASDKQSVTAEVISEVSPAKEKHVACKVELASSISYPGEGFQETPTPLGDGTTTDDIAAYNATISKMNKLAYCFFKGFKYLDETKGLDVNNLKIETIEDAVFAKMLVESSVAKSTAEGATSLDGILTIGGTDGVTKNVSIDKAVLFDKENVLFNQGKKYGFNDLRTPSDFEEGELKAVSYGKLDIPKDLYGKTIVEVGEVDDTDGNGIVSTERDAFTVGEFGFENVSVFTVSVSGKVRLLTGAEDGSEDYKVVIDEDSKTTEYGISLIGQIPYTGRIDKSVRRYDKVITEQYTNQSKVENIDTSEITGLDALSLSESDFKDRNAFISANGEGFKLAGEYPFFYKTGGDRYYRGLLIVDKYNITSETCNWNVEDYKFDGKEHAPSLTKINLSAADSHLSDLTTGFKYEYYRDKDGKLEKVDKCVESGDYVAYAILSSADSSNFEIAPTMTGGKRIACVKEFTIGKAVGEPNLISKKEQVVYFDTLAHQAEVKYDIQDGEYTVKYYSDDSYADAKEIKNPSFREEGAHDVYYKLFSESEVANYDAATICKVKGKVTLTIKPIEVAITSPAKTVTATGKAIPVVAEATSNGTKINDATITLYAKNQSKSDSKYVEVKDGIKDVGMYTFKYSAKVGDQIINGVVDDAITIAKTSIAKAKATVAKATYNRKSQTANVTKVTLNGKTLKKGTDYTVATVKRTAAGTSNVKISGKGNYTGSFNAKFTIARKSVAKLSVKKVTKRVKSGRKYVNKEYIYVYDGKTKLVSGKEYKLTSFKSVKYVTKKVGKKYKKVKTTVTTKYVNGLGNYTGKKVYK